MNFDGRIEHVWGVLDALKDLTNIEWSAISDGGQIIYQFKTDDIPIDKSDCE